MRATGVFGSLTLRLAAVKLRECRVFPLLMASVDNGTSKGAALANRRGHSAGVAFAFVQAFRPRGNESITTLAGTSGGSSEAIPDAARPISKWPTTLELTGTYADRMLNFR
jgi:hypothetical protein